MTPPPLTTPLRRLSVLGLAVVLAIGVSACGGDSGRVGGRDGASAGGSGGASDSTPANGAMSGATQPVATDEVDILDFNFAPPDVKVKTGQTVTWTNRDSFDHTVTAKDRSYDSANMAQGKTFSHTYDRPGTYAYFCAIHNSMTGTVVVE